MDYLVRQPYETEEEILKLGEIDPEFAALLKAHPPPAVDYSSLESFTDMAERRNILLREMFGTVPPTINKTETTYTTSDGTSLRALVFQPTSPPENGSPLVVVFHGGGWCIGAPEGEEQTCRNLVHAFGAVCVSVQYRLAPKWKFPHGVNDAWDALRWAAAKAKSFGADPSLGFVVGGSSAGGNLAAVMAHKARDHGLNPPLTGQYLAIPATCPPSVTPQKYQKYMLSAEQNRDVPVLPMDAVKMFSEGYEPDINDGENYAVLNHPNGLSGLPPALLMIAGLDPLRDEALIYDRALREKGVETRIYMYPGLPHGFWGFFPTMKSSDQYRVDQMEGFGWLFRQKPDLRKILKSAKPAVV